MFPDNNFCYSRNSPKQNYIPKPETFTHVHVACKTSMYCTVYDCVVVHSTLLWYTRLCIGTQNVVPAG